MRLECGECDFHMFSLISWCLFVSFLFFSYLILFVVVANILYYSTTSNYINHRVKNRTEDEEMKAFELNVQASCLARFGGGSTSSCCCCISCLVNPCSESESAMVEMISKKKKKKKMLKKKREKKE